MGVPVDYRPAGNPTLTRYVILDDWGSSGLDDDGTEWWTTKFDGWAGTPGVRAALTPRVQGHGAFDSPNFYDTRIITLEGTAIAASEDLKYKAVDTVTSLAAWNPATLYPLVVTEPGRPDRRAMVRLSSPTKVDVFSEYAFDWSIQLVAPDPRRYANDETVLTLTLPAAGSSGLTFPATFPATFPESGLSSGAATATNVGTIATQPTITFTGPLVDPQIANVTQGRTLTFNITLSTGDTLIVDTANKTVLLGGTASRAYTIQVGSAWWDLDPGGNDIKFTGGGGSGTAEIRYRSAWL